jgi:hypothetical protein
LLDTSGNPIKAIGGLAFDRSRRLVWYSRRNRFCNGSILGPSQGDGFIYKTSARFGGIVSAIPDPGGVGGPGIGALDYDPEEDVLWAAVYRPVNGQSIFYKLDPANGNVLKTISIPATVSTGTFPGPETNDTLAIARPGDLAGVKVLLTDAGARDTSTLYAIDVNSGAIVKTYAVSGLGGIDIDEETGNLLWARDGLDSITVGNHGPAPYDGSKFGLLVERDLTAPTHLAGDIAIEPLSCGVETIDRPQPQSISGHDWSMNVEVSDDDGVVLRDVMLGERYMAKEMSLPYFVLQTSVFPATRGELKPDSTDATARSRLVSYAIDTDSEKLIIEATYVVESIPATSQSCLFVTQRYEFHKGGVGCEPSENLRCNRFKPIVKYHFVSRESNFLISFNTVQRHYFKVDDKPVNSAAIFRDCDNPLEPTPCFGELFFRKRNPLLLEHLARVINNGQDTQVWDNLHQTSFPMVEEPTRLGLAGVTDEAGCPDCVHVHWRWAIIASQPPFGNPSFGLGQPLIPNNSDQSVDFAVVRWKPDEDDPNDYTALVLDSPEGFSNNIVFWYSATGHLNQDIFFGHGGFFNFAFRHRTDQSGPVSIDYFNLYEEGPLMVTAIDPTAIGNLPNGYTVYDNLAYDIKTEAVVSGPHRVTFELPSGIDPIVLANLRVFHKTGDPNNPAGTMLVDRTVDDTGGIFGLKINTEKSNTNFILHSEFAPTLTAEVDFLGQFVIALRPYLSPTSQDFPSGGGTGNIAVTAAANSNWTAVSNDNFITITSGNNGSANQTVSYSVAPNQSFRTRTGTITIVGQTFTVTQAGADCSLTPMPISVGQTINGELTLSDCLSGVTTERISADRYSFSASAGDQVSILLVSEAFIPYLYLIAPDGTPIAEAVAGIPQEGGLFTLPSSGTYIIEASVFLNDAKGNYTLTLSDTICAYSISPGNQSFAASGGSGNISVTGRGGCDWTAVSNDSFITLSSGSSGNGNGTVGYNVATSSSSNSRAGTMTIAGQTFTVIQQGAPPTCQITCPANLTVSNTAGQCGAAVNYALPTTTGTCGALTCSPASGSFFTAGTTTVTCTVAAGPSCTFTVTVNDTQSPTITCPANINISTGSSCVVVNYPAPTASDNCSGVTVTCTPASGTCFNIGTTPVTCTATDTSAQTVSCTFNVIVEACTITCPANLTKNNDPGQCGAVVNYPTPTTSGGCGTITCSPASGSFFSKGTTTVTCGLAAGASCSFTVTVNDTQAPTITCPANLAVPNDAGQCSAVVNYAAPATSDNCPGVTTVCSPASGSVFAKGTTTITCVATDAAGNTVSCSFTARVNDTQPPTIACPANLTAATDFGQCSAVVGYPTPVVSDNCAGVTTVCSPASGSAFPKGTTTVSCLATDASGNSGLCSFTVTVNDTQAPTLSCSVEDSSIWPPNHNLINIGLAATASDNCSPNATITVQVFSDEDDEAETGEGNFSPDAKEIAAGTLRLRRERDGNADGRVYLIIVTATDLSGNVSRCYRTVTVPKSNSAAHRADAEAQAAAARAHCEQFGTTPTNYFLVGDGAIVGPKQ